MHSSLTASVLILDPAEVAGAALLFYAFALATAAWLMVMVIAAGNGWFGSGPQPGARRPAGAAHRRTS